MPKAKKIMNYSDSETKVKDVLSAAGEAIDTLTITKRYYARKPKPFNGRQIVSGLLRSLKKKAEHNKESWAVKASKRRGPHPIEWWVE